MRTNADKTELNNHVTPMYCVTKGIYQLCVTLLCFRVQGNVWKCNSFPAIDGIFHQLYCRGTITYLLKVYRISQVCLTVSQYYKSCLYKAADNMNHPVCFSSILKYFNHETL